jgi:hypothetical protein
MIERLLEAERKAAELELRIQQLLRESERAGQESRLLYSGSAWPGMFNHTDRSGSLVTTPPAPTVGYLEVTILGCQSVPAAGATVTLVATGSSQTTDGMGKVTFSGVPGSNAITDIPAFSTYFGPRSTGGVFPVAGATATRIVQMTPLTGHLCVDCGTPAQISGRTVSTNLGHTHVYTAGEVDFGSEITLGPVKATFLGGNPPRMRLKCVAHGTNWTVVGTTSSCTPYAATFDFTGTHHDTSHGVTTVDIY